MQTQTTMRHRFALQSVIANAIAIAIAVAVAPADRAEFAATPHTSLLNTATVCTLRSLVSGGDPALGLGP